MSLINREDLMQTLGITDMDCEKCGWYSRTARRCKRGSDFEDACCAIDDALEVEPEPQWIPCSERLPEEYGEYRITWVTSYAPSKRFIGDSEYEVTSVWDEERKDFKGEWLLDEYIKHYPDVKVIAWKPLEEPYQAERRTDE